jgi:hypothetical protein
MQQLCSISPEPTGETTDNLIPDEEIFIIAIIPDYSGLIFNGPTDKF